jgi:hypothetical protein
VKFSPIWRIVLAAWFIVWGVLGMGWITFDNSGDVLAIGAIAVGVLVLIDR